MPTFCAKCSWLRLQLSCHSASRALLGCRSASTRQLGVASCCGSSTVAMAADRLANCDSSFVWCLCCATYLQDRTGAEHGPA
jgi:hypothetical protein